ncbi:hypothetical protein DYH09_09125 [bacterium CPR1]|nr:hypothetical protein [bacterium CPR1]
MIQTITANRPNLLTRPSAAVAPNFEEPAADRFVSSPAEEPPAPPPPPPAPEKKRWCVMVYSASDNNLYRFMQTDLDEAERVGCTDTMHVIAQTDHGPRGGTVQRIELQKDESPGLNAPVKQDLGSADMADPRQMADFIKWGMANYPADHYMLVISDHGDGWKGAAEDVSHHGWMSTPEIEQGLKLAREETGKKVDVLGFDACLMASAEVAYQLKDEIDYLVASQELEGGAGWQYNRVLSESNLRSLDRQLSMRFNMNPREVAAHVVECAAGNQQDLPTMSAIATSAMPAVASALEDFSAAVVSSIDTIPETLKLAARQTQGFYDYKDIGDFARRVQEGVREQDPALAATAGGLLAAVDEAVVAEQHSSRYPNARGMSIELSNRDTDGEPYGQLKLAQVTDWDGAVSRVQS